MNPEITQLLEQLAAKFGTTVEYLWSVLVRQSRIDAIVGILFLVSMAIVLLCLIVLVVKKTRPRERTSYDHYGRPTGTEMRADWGADDGAAARWGVGILCFIFFVTVWIMAPTIVTGFVNPEYTALMRVMSR